MRTRVVALLYVLHCCDAVRPVAVPRRMDAPPTNVALPTVAVAISGAVRSFATVPVLRGLKRLGLYSNAIADAGALALSRAVDGSHREAIWGNKCCRNTILGILSAIETL